MSLHGIKREQEKAKRGIRVGDPNWTGLAAGVLMLSFWGQALAGPHEDANAADKRGDYAAELAILRPNADRGLPWAENNLANLYDAGTGVPKDYEKAVFWYRKAADQRDPGAETNLGIMYHQGHGVPQDDLLAEKWIRKAADQNYPRASLALIGLAIPDSDAPPAPREAAAKAAGYRAAGDKGDETARMLLKMLCLWPSGSSPPADCAEVAVWTRAAAERGDVRAQEDLAQMYDTGADGLKADPAQAMVWSRKAAESGEAAAESSLAMRYEMGMGLQSDEAQAFAWYRKAAVQGDMMGQMDLARRYETGEGVAKDDAQAFYWNRKLADQGIDDAERKVGAAYAFGRGVAQDYVQAYMWLDIALSSKRALNSENHDAETIALEGVAAHLTPAQLAEAKRLSAAWQAGKDQRMAAIFKAKAHPK
jgi:hypothetical protein